MSAARSRVLELVAAIDAMMTGEALMLRALTVGSTPCGRPSARMFSSIVARVSLTFVPNSNWATTSAIELADVDRSESRRAMPWMERSMGSATWAATSVAPAPG